MLREKFIELHAYILKKLTQLYSSINLEEEETKLKASRRKEVANVREEISEIENNTIKKSTKLKLGFLKQKQN